MAATPFDNNKKMYFFGRLSDLKPSALMRGAGSKEPDVVIASAEAQKQQILSQVRGEVLEQIRGAQYDE